MKICPKCRKLKPSDEFYKNKSSKDGLGPYCKLCTKIWQLENAAHLKDYCHRRYMKNRVAIIARNKSWSEANSDRHAALKQRWNLGHPQKAKLYRGKYEIKFPERVTAKKLVQKAISAGEIVPSPCEVCGEKFRIEAHHQNYTKPLEVIWLCRLHHRETHKNHGGSYANYKN